MRAGTDPQPITAQVNLGGVMADAPYAAAMPCVLNAGPLLVSSPAYLPAPPEHELDEELAPAFQGRTEPAVGWGQGNFVLNTQDDRGVAPIDANEELPALQDGRILFTRRTRSAGDQAALDDVLRRGGSYVLDIHPEGFY